MRPFCLLPIRQAHFLIADYFPPNTPPVKRPRRIAANIAKLMELLRRNG
jgi:hypothetical protein